MRQCRCASSRWRHDHAEAARAAVSRGNLSAWAVAHPSLVLFLIIVFSLAGLVSYMGLGRAEDPSFAIKTMVVTAAWPGATAEEMQDQVADKLEKRLQELELFDYVKTYTRPGVTVIQVQLKDMARGKDVDDACIRSGRSSPTRARRCRRACRGLSSTTSTATSIPPSTCCRGADVPLAKLKDYAEIVRQRLLRTEGVAKVDIVGSARPAHLHRVQSPQAGDARHHPTGHLRQRGTPERRDAVGHRRDQRRPHRRAHQRRLQGRGGHRRGSHRGGRGDLQARRHRHRQARL